MIKTCLNNFLKKHNPVSSPFVLALSGGPDSLALYHALMELNIPFAVAHVDHRWRNESQMEAKILKERAKQDGIPFHLKVLDAGLKSEKDAREQRLHFFQSLANEFGYSAVMLGHQRNDQAETLLKRLFEGAPIEKLEGIKQVSLYKKLTLWRPLLSLSKQAILNFLQKRQIRAFDDPTNRDPKYLRSRMRVELIPELEQIFGKNIEASLYRLSTEMKEAFDWVQAQIPPSEEFQGPFGAYIDLSPYEHPFIIKHLVRQWVKDKKIDISFENYNTLAQHVINGSANKWINEKMYIDRKQVFLMQEQKKLHRCIPSKARKKIG